MCLSFLKLVVALIGRVLKCYSTKLVITVEIGQAVFITCQLFLTPKHALNGPFLGCYNTERLITLEIVQESGRLMCVQLCTWLEEGWQGCKQHPYVERSFTISEAMFNDWNLRLSKVGGL